MYRLRPSLLCLAVFFSAVSARAYDFPPGSNPSTALASCDALRSAGVALSGTYWIQPAGTSARTAYCDMETNGGGWTLVYNSVLGVNTTEFWNIPHLERFSRRGSPRIESLFYDGSYYAQGKYYMDVIEDLNGKSVVVLVAEANGIDPYSMRFISPRYNYGSAAIYSSQFASGWSSPDFDSDGYSANCATRYANVTQHYSSCHSYNLGADGDSSFYDGGAGPHLNSSAASALGLAVDGSSYTRVRRISRFVKW